MMSKNDKVKYLMTKFENFSDQFHLHMVDIFLHENAKKRDLMTRMTAKNELILQNKDRADYFERSFNAEMRVTEQIRDEMEDIRKQLKESRDRRAFLENHIHQQHQYVKSMEAVLEKEGLLKKMKEEFEVNSEPAAFTYESEDEAPSFEHHHLVDESGIELSDAEEEEHTEKAKMKKERDAFRPNRSGLSNYGHVLKQIWKSKHKDYRTMLPVLSRIEREENER
jgi:hypothetical protein